SFGHCYAGISALKGTESVGVVRRPTAGSAASGARCIVPNYILVDSGRHRYASLIGKYGKHTVTRCTGNRNARRGICTARASGRATVAINSRMGDGLTGIE